MASRTILDLDQLTIEIPALTESFAGQMQTAILMCFQPHCHSSGILCDLKDLEETLDTVEIKWKNSYSERIRRAFGEPRNAAERAGEGIAILTILAFTKYTAIERAPIGSGFDFWLGLREGADSFIFQRDARLEVKGVSDAEFPSEITREVRKGIKQTKRSDNTWLPAFVIVTEFSRPVIYMVQR